MSQMTLKMSDLNLFLRSNINQHTFCQYVACPKCKSWYTLEESYIITRSSSDTDKRKKKTKLRKKCRTPLMKKPISPSGKEHHCLRQVYCYKKNICWFLWKCKPLSLAILLKKMLWLDPTQTGFSLEILWRLRILRGQRLILHHASYLLSALQADVLKVSQLITSPKERVSVMIPLCTMVKKIKLSVSSWLLVAKRRVLVILFLFSNFSSS